MASVRFAWGIDIGNRALKAIKLVRGESGLKIDDFEIIEHENVLSNAGDNKEELIRSALANFAQRHETKGGVAAVSVSGVSSFARVIKLPPVESKKIPEIVRFEAIQQIPFPLDDVEWAYQLFQTPDSPDVEVGIFAMRRELVNQHIANFTNVGLNVQVVQMSPLAVYNAMYYDGRLKGTTMMIDLGAENTDLIIADGETIWMRSIPIGGNNFTEVLVKAFKLPFAKAEELKRNANTSKYARQIFQAMRPVFADLVAEVQRSIGFYSSVHRDSRIKKIIALGGTFRLAGLQKYLQQNLQLEVEKLNDLAAGAPPDAKLAATFNQNLLSMVGAYGLAIQGMGEGKISSSLLPQHIRREKMWRDKTKWFATATAVFVLGTGLALGGYYLRSFQLSQNKSVFDANNDLLQKAQGMSNSWDQNVTQVGAPDRISIQNVKGMVAYRNNWEDLIQDVYAALPPLPAGYATGDVEKIKSVPRNKRNIITIDSFSSVYSGDLATDVAALASGVPGAAPGAPGAPTVAPGTPGAAPADPAIPAGSRGFIITLSITTPHNSPTSAPLFVLNNFSPKLAAYDRKWMDAYNLKNPRDQKRYYIAKVMPPSAAFQLNSDSIRMQAMETSYTNAMTLLAKPTDNTGAGSNPGAAPAPGPAPAPSPPEVFRNQPGGFGGGGGFGAPAGAGGFGAAAQPAGPVTIANPEAVLDRLTGEDRSQDWEMKIQFVVIVDPPPLPPTPPQ
jgi:type IV pilus assembly protein PilM